MEKRAKEILHPVICLRNPLKAVNRLPREIIAMCAAFVPRTDPKPIVSLTHVCRYWREAIISSPRNWTLIGSGWQRLVPLCLERAGETPLAVGISVPSIKEKKNFVRALLPRIPRISHLSLAGFSSIEKVADDLPAFFASPMTDLTSLELDQRKAPTERFPSNEDPAPPLFRSVSKLTSLRLFRIPLYPALFNIASLVELQLTDYKIPLQKFIGFLESNFSLEIVVLNIEFVKGSVSTAPEINASLPRLRRLALTCYNAIDARGLLSCLSLPRGVDIEVHGSKQNPCGDLASFLPCPPTPIQDILDPITTIRSWHFPRQLHLFGNDGSFSFHSHSDPSRYYQEFDLFATGAVRQIHLVLNTWLRMVGPNDNISRPFEHLPALEALVLSGGRYEPGPLTALAKNPALCPSLKTVALLDCMESPEAFRELESMLTERERSTVARVHRVVIANKRRDMPNQIQSVGRLRMLVPRVDTVMGDERYEFPDLL